MGNFNDEEYASSFADAAGEKKPSINSAWNDGSASDPVDRDHFFLGELSLDHEVRRGLDSMENHVMQLYLGAPSSKRIYPAYVGV